MLKRLFSMLMVLCLLGGLVASTAYAATLPKIKQVKLNKTKIELVGKSQTLKATVKPSSASQVVTWTSSNKKVCTVNMAGVVTPKGPGTATITATSLDGTMKATCKVTVPKTKTYTKTYTVAKEWPYTMKDTISVTVDGVTGKILDADVFQVKKDDGFFGMVGKDGCKITYKCDKYIEVRTNWSLDVGVWKLNLNAFSLTCTYRMYNDGTLKLLKKVRN